MYIAVVITTFSVLCIDGGRGMLTGSGPIFILQPPSLVLFINSNSTHINCIVHGSPPPKVQWIHVSSNDNEAKVTDIPGLLSVHANNSILFNSFQPEQYDQKIHSTGYRCKATNIHGTIISRVTTVKAVVDQEYRTQVYDEYVILGNTAVFKCIIPSYINDYVQVLSWLINDNLRVSDKHQTERYSILSNGNLLVRRVEPDDSESFFKCHTKHTVSKQTRISDKAGRLYVTKPSSSIAPRILDPIPLLKVKKGDKVEIPCVSQGHPTPKYTWCFKEDKNSPCANVTNEGDKSKLSKVIISGPTLIRASAKSNDRGHYVCTATNDLGRAESSTNLVVIEPITVFLHPQRQLLSPEQRVILKCVVSGGPITSLTWMRNGKIIQVTQEVSITADDFMLNFPSANRETSGMFQCFVSNGLTTEQATGEVVLTSSVPVILSHFKPRIVDAGRKVVLKCTSIGIPTPKLIWKLAEDLIIPDGIRFTLREKIEHNTIGSILTINNIRSLDSGLYTCESSNKAGNVGYSSNVRVYGPLAIRPIRNQTVVDRQKLVLHCHVSGYPLGDIEWIINGQKVYSTNNEKTLNNGTLLISEAMPEVHSGKYTCTVKNKKGLIESENHGWIKVVAKPVLLPWLRHQILKMRGRLTIFCGIQSGEPPFRFSWTLNGQVVPYDLGATITDTSDSTSLKIENIGQKHSGNYSCNVGNVAGSASEFTIIKVEGPPIWIHKPFSISASGQRSEYWIRCQGRSYPPPIARWYKITNDERAEEVKNTTKSIVFANGTLHIRDIDEELSGKYKCVISNGIQPDIQETIDIVVGDAPSIVNLVNRLNAIIGEKLRLKCFARGIGPLSVTWMRGNTLIELRSDSRINILTSKTESGILSTLTIRNIESVDLGNYKCEVRNKYGQDEMNVTVQTDEPFDNYGGKSNKRKNIPMKGRPTVTVPESATNMTSNNLEDHEFLGVAILYIIPTTTAAIVLLIVLVIVCILLKRQTRAASANQDDSYKMKSMGSTSKSVGIMRTIDRDDKEYQMQMSRNAHDDIYASPLDGSEIQPYATFTSGEERYS
ncbi:Uncharacterised protein at_DN0010 [Pycnogonum litorale]